MPQWLQGIAARLQKAVGFVLGRRLGLADGEFAAGLAVSRGGRGGTF